MHRSENALLGRMPQVAGIDRDEQVGRGVGAFSLQAL